MNRSSSLMQAAVVLNSLPKRQAAQLLSRLEPGDMQSLLDAVTRLDDISADQLTVCLRKLADESARWRLSDQNESDIGIEEAKRQIDSALAIAPTRVEQNIWANNPFDFLIETIPMLRDHVLGDEHPKNIAIVLSCLPPEIASQAMNGLDRHLRVSVLKRICELDEISEEEIRELSFSLRLRLNKLLNTRAAKSAGMSTAANLLSCSDADTREALLAYVSQSDPDLAFKLQRSVFGIERLEAFENDQIKTILKHVDTSYWAPALKNGSTGLMTKILENMADQPRELLAHEIDNMGHVNVDAEDEARKNIVKIVLRLGREGKIELRKSGPRLPNAIFPMVDVPVVHDISLSGS